MPDDTLAYDGSNAPARRKLTARERDILTRMISDVQQAYRRLLLQGKDDFFYKGSPLLRPFDLEEVALLAKVADAIDPRAMPLCSFCDQAIADGGSMCESGSACVPSDRWERP